MSYARKDVKSVTVVEDEAVWKDDGNVIVAAGTNPKILFKCHWSMLAGAIPALTGVLSMPQPSDEERYQGLPVVTFPDHPEDMRAFIRMVYDGTLIPHKIRAVGILDKISGPLRLAKKYDTEALFKRLAVKDALLLANESLPDEEEVDALAGEHTFTYQGRHSPDPVPVIRLARELDIRSVLPAAFYELHKWYPPQWLPYEIFAVSVIAPLIVQESMLTREDFRTLTFGKTRLQACFDAILSRLANIAFNWTCKSKGAAEVQNCPCKLGIHKSWERARTELHSRYEIVPRDPLAGLQKAARDFSADEQGSDGWERELAGVCGTCRRTFVKHIVDMRAKLWKALPGIFIMEDAWGTEMEFDFEPYP